MYCEKYTCVCVYRCVCMLMSFPGFTFVVTLTRLVDCESQPGLDGAGHTARIHQKGYYPVSVDPLLCR